MSKNNRTVIPQQTGYASNDPHNFYYDYASRSSGGYRQSEQSSGGHGHHGYSHARPSSAGSTRVRAPAGAGITGYGRSNSGTSNIFVGGKGMHSGGHGHSSHGHSSHGHGGQYAAPSSGNSYRVSQQQAGGQDQQYYRSSGHGHGHSQDGHQHRHKSHQSSGNSQQQASSSRDPNQHQQSSEQQAQSNSQSGGKYGHWSTSYKLHYGHGQNSGQGQSKNHNGNVVYAAPPNPNNPSGVNYNHGVIYGANGQVINGGAGGTEGTAAGNYSRPRPMSAGATVSSSRNHQQQAQVQQHQQPQPQQSKHSSSGNSSATVQKVQTSGNLTQAAQAASGNNSATVTIPTATPVRPSSAGATKTKPNSNAPAANAADGEPSEEEAGVGVLGENSGLNGMANPGRKAASSGNGAGKTGETTGDYVEIDEEEDEFEASTSRRNPAGRSTNSGVIDHSQSRTHPEVSTVGDLAGGTVSMDIRSVDSSYLQEQPVSIGLTTVPNQFCSVAEAIELRKLLMMGNNNVRGGIIPSSTAVMDMYMVGKVIGVGSYGKVRAAWHRLTGSKVAIKTYDKAKLKDPAHWKRVHSEIKITEQTSHPRIARLYEAIETPKRMHLIMECLDGGNLCSYVKQKRRLSEDESRRIFFQLIQAIDYLHVMGVAHRDIKLENVLFGDSKDIKLIDFGFSTVCVPGKKLRVFCGTPSYMAPEIVRRVEYDGKPTDMWSLGILLYALLCGCFPFRAKTYPDLYRRIARGTFTVPDELSVSVRDLLRQLLNIEPTQRITAAATLRHPWLQSQFAQASDINKMRLESTILVSDRPTDDIDDQLLGQLEEFGLSEKEVVQLVMTKTHTSITTLYYLLLDVLISERRRGGNRKALPSGLNTLRKQQQGNNGGVQSGTGTMGLRSGGGSGDHNSNSNAMEMHYVSNNGVPIVLNSTAASGGHTSRPKSASSARPSHSNRGNDGGASGGDAVHFKYIDKQSHQGHQQQGITSNIPSRPLSAAAGRRR